MSRDQQEVTTEVEASVPLIVRGVAYEDVDSSVCARGGGGL
jgi:hypothetical protein